MCSPHYPVTTRMVTDQIHLEFGSDDETDGGDDDGEAEKPEEALVLAFRDDGYLLLPAIDSNTPLEMLKWVLRVYVQKVCSKCSSSGRCASLTILISEFQKLSGRTPWAAIWANNDAHIVPTDQIYLGQPILNDTPGGALLFESLVFPPRGQKSMAPQVSEAGT